MHSDSWGSSAEGVYDSMAVGVDAFAWGHQDFLPVIAAGNFGARGTDSSVASPSTAKNCLSVGARGPHLAPPLSKSRRRGKLPAAREESCK